MDRNGKKNLLKEKGKEQPKREDLSYFFYSLLTMQQNWLKFQK